MAITSAQHRQPDTLKVASSIQPGVWHGHGLCTWCLVCASVGSSCPSNRMHEATNHKPSLMRVRHVSGVNNSHICLDTFVIGNSRPHADDSKCVLWHTNACPGKAMCARVGAQQKIRSREITERSGPTEITQRERERNRKRKI